MNRDKELITFIFKVTNWAVSISTILNGASLEGINIKSCSRLSNFLDLSLILYIASICCLKNHISIIVSDMLFSCTGNSIVMLVNTKSIHHAIFGIKYLFNFLIRCILVDNFGGKQFV